MRALLVNPVTHDSPWVPLNLLYLAGTLEANGIYTSVADGNAIGMDAILSKVDMQYDVVGISVSTRSRWNSFDLSQLVRRRSPKSVIVMGGVHATVMSEQCKKYSDVVIRGDGEGPFLDVCSGRNPVERVLPIDSLYPAWNKINLWEYPKHRITKYNFSRVNGVDLSTTPRVSIQASRGCLSHCRFCSSFYVQGRYRMRNPSKVASEIEYLYGQGIRHFYFNDDSFYLDIQKGMEFCNEIIGRKLKIAFHIETRADIITEEYAKVLKQAGCYRVQIGLETGSDELLERMNKKTTSSEIVKGIASCKKAGLKVDANVIIGNEDETDETIELTRKFLKSARPSTLSSSWKGLWIFPGTAVYQRAIREGFISANFWESRVPLISYKFSQAQINKWNTRVATYNFIPALRYYLKRLEGLCTNARSVAMLRGTRSNFL